MQTKFFNLSVPVCFQIRPSCFFRVLHSILPHCGGHPRRDSMTSAMFGLLSSCAHRIIAAMAGATGLIKFAISEI